MPSRIPVINILNLEKFGWIFGAILLSLCCVTVVGLEEKPVTATPCQLKADPAAFNHKVVEVTGFFSHGFEDFTLFDPGCPSWPGVWLEYGGTTKSGTMYCCGVTATRSRDKQLVVEGIEIGLVADDRFQQFDKLIQRRPDSVVHATILGRFFSGTQVKYPSGLFWSGYGHMGCCSLLAIEQVVAVDPHDRSDLDYRSSPDQPAVKVGCGYKYLTDLRRFDQLVKAQATVDLGQSEWALNDPKQVATNELARLLNTNGASITGLTVTSEAQGRVVYTWRPKGKSATYLIVVSRPYWLSFYAKDPKRVAWVVIAAYEAFCE